MGAPKKTETLLKQLNNITDELWGRRDDLTLTDKARILGDAVRLNDVARRRQKRQGAGKMWR